MWSGPRNLSTALMRSFENRGDAIVVDEPFYSHYLVVTGLEHPMRDEVIASQPTDWREVVAELLGPLPEGIRVQYQKQMAHHLLPDMGRDWFGAVTHAFLIRDPRPMLTSLAHKLETCTLADTGLPQQVEIFDYVIASTGATPAVVDAVDLLTAPGAVLSRLCSCVGLPFTTRMLEWPPGPRASDGVWARHWYDRVERTTRFEPLAAMEGDAPGARATTSRPDTEPASPSAGSPLTDELARIEAECRPLYEKLRAHRLRA
jgi:hypothetical protein